MVAALVLATWLPAQAQVPQPPPAGGSRISQSPGTTGSTDGRGNALPGQPFFFDGSFFQFVPGLGFVPTDSFGTPLFDPSSNFRSGSSFFIPNSGFGDFNPFFNPWLGGVFPVPNPGRPVTPGEVTADSLMRGYFGRRTMVPVAGINAPPLGQRSARSTTGTRSRVLREGTASTSQEKALTANRIEAIMDRSALVEGRTMASDNGTISVRLGSKGTMVTRSYPAHMVFFIEADGDLTSASKADARVDAGQRVFVPEPINGIGQRVAGSRQVTTAATVKSTSRAKAKKSRVKKKRR